MTVSGCESADDACAGDGGVNDGDDVCELGFEDGVEVGGGGESGEAVSECQDLALRLSYCCLATSGLQLVPALTHALVSLEKTPISVEFSNCVPVRQ